MAIIIPSKHIYDISNNKIIENKIDKIEVNSVNVSTVENTDVNVYNNDLLSAQLNLGEPISNTEKEVFDCESAPIDAVLQNYAYVYFDNEIKYASTILTIPKFGINERIDKIEKVELSVYGTKIVRDMSATLNITRNQAGSSYYYTASLGEISYGARSEKEGVFEFPETPEKVVASTSGVYASVLGVEDLSFYNLTEDEDNFYLYFYKMASYVSRKFSRASTFDGSKSSVSERLNGTYTYYEPYKISVSVNGNKKTIDIKDVNQIYGNPNSQNLFSIESNELMQITNYHNKKVEGTLSDRVKVDLLPHNAKNTLDQYAKGKETATILCSISDYYDQDGNKVIDITQQGKMMFKEFDVVIPYIYNARREDVPMSVRKDNTAKEFTIVSVEPFYDGAVWQRLYLLEKTQEKQT